MVWGRCRPSCPGRGLKHALPLAKKCRNGGRSSRNGGRSSQCPRRRGPARAWLAACHVRGLSPLQAQAESRGRGPGQPADPRAAAVACGFELSAGGPAPALRRACQCHGLTEYVTWPRPARHRDSATTKGGVVALLPNVGKRDIDNLSGLDAVANLANLSRIPVAGVRVVRLRVEFTAMC